MLSNIDENFLRPHQVSRMIVDEASHRLFLRALKFFMEKLCCLDRVDKGQGALFLVSFVQLGEALKNDLKVSMLVDNGLFALNIRGVQQRLRGKLNAFVDAHSDRHLLEEGKVDKAESARDGASSLAVQPELVFEEGELLELEDLLLQDD